jgi:hypothetical protein
LFFLESVKGMGIFLDVEVGEDSKLLLILDGCVGL